MRVIVIDVTVERLEGEQDGLKIAHPNLQTPALITVKIEQMVRLAVTGEREEAMTPGHCVTEHGLQGHVETPMRDQVAPDTSRVVTTTEMRMTLIKTIMKRRSCTTTNGLSVTM